MYIPKYVLNSHLLKSHNTNKTNPLPKTNYLVQCKKNKNNTIFIPYLAFTHTNLIKPQSRLRDDETNLRHQLFSIYLSWLIVLFH